ncbi:MAG TPA: methyltransferase [Verrucomicrobiae bacterium]|nr:methyltransferase [Verrucomicrobiae bacterium]
MKQPKSPSHSPNDPFFKGWAKPGPTAPGALDKSCVIAEDETLDAISGHFRLFQLRDGHRFSTDDVLTAWYGTSWCPTAQTALDLGSGIGSVGMIAAWRLPGARFVTVEAQEESVRLARKSARYNGLEGRYEIRQGDFREPALIAPGERFDLVLGSPPYFPTGTGIEGDHPQKIACRFELRGDIADYCAVAAEHLAMGGFFACVFPTEQLARVEAAARKSGLSIIRRRPVMLREGDAPLISLFGMFLSAHLPASIQNQTWVEPPLIIRQKDGRVHPEYAAVKLAIGFPP